MVVTEEMGEHIFEMFSRSNPRRVDGNARPREGRPQLSESVELTPGGRKKHKLQRTSPGGTTRTSQYTSPSRAEVAAEMEQRTGFFCNMDVESEQQDEQMRRRCVAIEYVPGQQTEAQRAPKRARAIEYPCA